jgi:hypothetical protein
MRYRLMLNEIQMLHHLRLMTHSRHPSIFGTMFAAAYCAVLRGFFMNGRADVSPRSGWFIARRDLLLLLITAVNLEIIY